MKGENMSEEIKLYKLKKRLNSTLQATNGIQMLGDFKGPVDIMNPTIDLEMPLNQFDYNYMTWLDPTNNLLRYYWIKHRVYFPDNIIRLTLEEDPLPTFKEEIENCEFFIERSTNISSGTVTDTALTTGNGVNVDVVSADEFEHYGNGWYVVGIAGCYFTTAFAGSGGVFYYLCSGQTVFNLLTWLSNEGATGEWADYDPISRIVSIRYFPISFSAYTAATATVIFRHTYDDGSTPTTVWFTWQGSFVMTTGIPGISHDMIYTKSFSMNFSDHAQLTVADRNVMRFLNFAPYRDVTLFAGAFGKIDIPLNLIERNNESNVLAINVVFDLISGMSRIELYSDANKTNLIYSSEDYSMSVDCAITSENYNKYSDIMERDLRKQQYITEGITKAGAGAASLVGGIAAQNPLMIGSGISLIASAASTQVAGFKQYAIDSYNLSIPDVHTKGSNGSYSMIEKPWKLYTISHLIVNFPHDLFGYLCNIKQKLINSGGYTKCIGASFESEKATLEEILAVNDYLNNGFYHE